MKPSIITMRNVFFFFSAAATASPIFQALAPRSDAVIPGYFDQGCYTEGTNRRALTGMTYFDDQMTVEKCATACADFVWFGVEYGRECYCGNTLSAGSIPAPAADCNFHCPGNATESCGAGLRLNMYSKTTAAGLETLTTYGAMGCYTEATSGRALNALRVADDTMTIESCATACAGYAMFGLEYYREVISQIPVESCSAAKQNSSATVAMLSCLEVPKHRVRNVIMHARGTSQSSAVAIAD
jgi:hypothetical protein